MEKTITAEYKEIYIDVSGYEHPIPFDKVLELLFKLNRGEYIHMHHRKKPLPLIQFLYEQGFNCVVFQNSDGSWEIIIWHKKDTDVERYCLTRFSI
ncbi:MAG: DUF2249 domain-containing protein [gamma proteobacterium symbiont of Bathyaustriella thionipta]|nr:DUF2249 domain-containing protein [gamma proteobacterium symbiont of Bathyaustriella thionipta]MCU7951627.1 DUF2249 domain-containing protein [gamma proteobacterium symbiont of Bathyaustriella thionipta]MCU7954601.1 DUF2249 domain-containing protein [gamma proteobacterium symbiont of Bathyaustriella thionipta]MCU7958219.1 DUF2249 domain-containing protein [gamma proteobacterium symbiont of Bathyaustriella thionipta]